MATYLKRTSKPFDLSVTQTATNANITEFVCPVCRGILIEPVTLPCTHNLCLKCLKGTFEHNSLSCPLCRVRVGSWLRTATKSETLVNNGLWELIRAKFPKEVEDKFNGDDGDLTLDAGLSQAKILSAAGEIRREYEAQCQIAEKEMRLQREAAEMASQAFIRKIQEEEQHKLVQLAQDQLLARTLAKKQIKEKHIIVSNNCNDSGNVSTSSTVPSKCNMKSKSLSTDITKIEAPSLESGKVNLFEFRDGSELRRSNIALISKIRAERYASSLKDNSSNFGCQKPMPVYNAITRTLKHTPITKLSQPSTSNYVLETGCSTSKIYGTQSKEELHVPSDVLSCKKKSLGVEVCMTIGNDDGRIGSAESAGSHDSINQEIHHFKPIKAVSRTPLKITSDGKQNDIKLIRVVPIIKRISNNVPKPPTPSRMKRIVGCTWSAFRGKLKLDSNIEKQYNKEEQKPTTSYIKPQNIAEEPIKGFDFVSDIPSDSNKNSKFINKINGTKISKKLILEEQISSGKIYKHVKNGMVSKYKRQKISSISKKDIETMTSAKSDADSRDSVCSIESREESPRHAEEKEQSDSEIAIENIAERIKKRKIINEKKGKCRSRDSKLEFPKLETMRRRTRKVTLQENKEVENFKTKTKKVNKKYDKQTVPLRNNSGNNKKLDSPLDTNKEETKVRKSSRLYKTRNTTVYNEDRHRSLSSSCDEDHEDDSGNEDRDENLSDEDIVQEQKRIEKLVLQEKEDFELARRLQAQFDEMDQVVAGRTRRSRRAAESNTIELDLFKLKVGKSKKVSGKSNIKQSTNRTINSELKQRGRPPKRLLK